MSNAQTPIFDRRQLIAAGAGVAGVAAGVKVQAQTAQSLTLQTPCVVSTWPFGVAANAAAWAVLSKGTGAWELGRARRGHPGRPDALRAHWRRPLVAATQGSC